MVSDANQAANLHLESNNVLLISRKNVIPSITPGKRLSWSAQYIPPRPM